MSIGINVSTPDGMVLATDSRQSFRNRKGMTRIGSDNATKLFQLNERIGIATAGVAFLPEEGALKNLSKFLEQFRRETDPASLDVKSAAEKLHYHFNKKYKWKDQLGELEKKVRIDLQRQGLDVQETETEEYTVRFRFKDPQGNLGEGRARVDPVSLLVAGYDKNGAHEVYNCYIPGEIQKRLDSSTKGREYGAAWIGQTDVLQRVVLGFDSRIKNLMFVRDVRQTLGDEALNEQLRLLEYVIQWGTMTLQDAVDFCTLMIRTTAAFQRFSDGIAAEPGDLPGVGGPIDVATITPDSGFEWVKKKKLTLECE
jgi:20S proteasome alpha/beta subunit